MERVNDEWRVQDILKRDRLPIEHRHWVRACVRALVDRDFRALLVRQPELVGVAVRDHRVAVGALYGPEWYFEFRLG